MASSNRKKQIAFRLCAVLVGLLPFLAFELTLRSIGWRQLDGVKDPFVGFSSSRPLFELNDDRTVYKVSDSRKPLFCDESFPVSKSNDEFRIFCIGGSTVQGRPYAIETAFSTWLELSLQAADSRQFNVINCGGVSYASYRLAPIVEEILDYQPDLIVLYTGHNEFLEDRTYDSIKKTSPLILSVHEKLSGLKTYSFFRSLASPDQSNHPQRELLPGEVEARLDFRNGLEQYTRDEVWKANVVSHFRHNLERIVLAAQVADVPLMVCNPVSNLRDASPFKSQNKNGLSDAHRTQFQSSFEKLIGDQKHATSIDDLSALLKIDPYHAELQYRIGQAYQIAGDFKNAKRHLVEAKEQDVCPLRIIEPMYEVIFAITQEHEVPLVDVKSLFESKAADGIPGSELLVDHVHPSMRGHQLIAELIFEEMNRLGFVEIADGFETKRDNSFAAHFASLPNLYFELGKERLSALKGWAEGKTPQVRNRIETSQKEPVSAATE